MKKKLMLAIPAALIILSACASLSVTTWIIQNGMLAHGPDVKTPAQAEGYRCYSREDDTAWRTELKIQRDCCLGRSGGAGQ